MFVKSIFCSVVLLAATASAAYADDSITFKGAIQFTDVTTATCPDGPTYGEVRLSRLLPYVAGSNLSPRFVTTWDYGTDGYMLDGKNFTSSYQQVTYGHYGSVPGTGSDKPVYLKLVTSPATVTTSTTSLTISGTIANPWGEVGQEQCIAKFRGIFQKKLN